MSLGNLVREPVPKRVKTLHLMVVKLCNCLYTTTCGFASGKQIDGFRLCIEDQGGKHVVLPLTK